MQKPNFFLLAAILTLATVSAITNSSQAIVYQEWGWRSAGQNHDLFPACGLGVDSMGNTYTASGMNDDCEIFKFSPTGTLLWRVTFTDAVPADLVADAAGNVYVTGYTSTGCITFKYNTLGQSQWWATYNPQNGSMGKGIVLDLAGNVFVTCRSFVAENSNITTIKYNPLGVQLWVATYDSATDIPVDLAVDSTGNVYVVGFSYTGSSTDSDIITIKYNSQGVQQWIDSHQGPSQPWNSPLSLVLDEQANVYIAGTTDIALYDRRFIVLKYNQDGIRQWVALYASAYSSETAQSLTTDVGGNCVVVGYALSNPNPGLGIVVKYDPEGSLLWERNYPGLAYGVATDAASNIYVTGAKYLPTVFPPYFDRDCMTQKYDAQGNLLWAALYDTSTQGCIETGTHIALDRSGNVIVDGHFIWYEQPDSHPILVKYHQTPGNLAVIMTPAVSPVQIPPQGGSFTYDLLIVNGASNNLPVEYTWQVIYPDSLLPTSLPGLLQTILPLDSTTITRTQRLPGYATAGTYQYIVNVGDYPSLIWATDTIIVTKLGSGLQDSGCGEWTVDGWDQGTRNREQITGVDISALPNPFNPTTEIRCQIPDARKVNLKVYDTSGRQVATLAEGWQEAGLYKVIFDGSNLASGIYLYYLTAGDQVATGKMVLLK